jgi:hypothetical protein
MASRADFAACDLAVVVKRTPAALMDALRASGRPWAYDIVDAYPQPGSSTWTRTEAIAWVQRHLRALKPNAVIWPNKRMREDCDTGLPGIVLPHHHRPGIKANPIRPEVRTVGYEGREQYLRQWKEWMDRECARRGWRFVVNPSHLADVDIVVALRGGHWSGYVSRHWKSGVKLANAQGSGTPFIGESECGYTETASGAEYWANTPQQMRTSLDWLESQSAREQVSDRMRQAAYPVERAARDLGDLLGRL